MMKPHYLKLAKSQLFTLAAVAFCFTLVLSSCNQSQKGKWSEADKAEFIKDVNEVPDLANFGKNKSKWVNLYLKKCEANYNSYADANNDEAGITKLALECNDEVLSNGSVKGKWSDDDKQKFREEMKSVKELLVFGTQKEEWINCYLESCEVNYASYYHANQDEKGVEKLANKCTEGFLSSK